ncbi:MAG: glycoside hydrolase family 2 [Clostridiales bacterium]|nr:glycoside hydrolase family 2 [Clostridiales bacterium]
MNQGTHTVQYKIRTKWADNINIKSPLCEYPRKQMQRSNWQCLNGQWNYAVTDIGSGPPKTMGGTITVPYAIESALSGVCQALLPTEKLTYTRTFTTNISKPGHITILHFEAVDWECTVYVNEKEVGTHTGGYIPFSFNITDLLIPGENLLTVVVTDPTDTNWQQRGKQVLKPRTIWYTATSGIWQTVWLETIPIEHIKSLKITPCTDLESVSIYINSITDETAHVDIMDSGQIVASADITTNRENILSVPMAKLWTPDNPFLYDLKISTETDTVISYFGMRSITVKMDSSGRNKIFLNNKPIFLNGPLDQGYWPESGMTPPCDEAMIFDLQAMKDLGFNMIRKHVKVESRRWYYHADRLGLLVVQDMPNGGKRIVDHVGALVKTIFGNAPKDDTPMSYHYADRSSLTSRKNFESELDEMLIHLQNHPSIVIWCPFNEGWGQFDSWRIYKHVKSADPTRLVDHASGWHDQGCGDFLSIHTYKTKLKAPSANDRRAFFITEYGGYNYLDKGHLWRDDDDYGYKYFTTTEKLNKAYESLITDQVIPLIDKGLCGVVYTQLSDVEIETNAIFTYDRKVLKFNEAAMKKLHALIQNRFNEFNS